MFKERPKCEEAGDEDDLGYQQALSIVARPKADSIWTFASTLDLWTSNVPLASNTIFIAACNQ